MNKQEFKQIIIPIFISSLIIMILQNFKFAGYDKYFIFPSMLLLISYIYILYKKDMIINEKGYIYLIPIILIILGTVILKTNISNMILNIFIIPILMSFLFLSLTNKNYYVSGRFLKWFSRLFPSGLFSNLKVIKKNIDIKNTNKKKITNVLIGILISIPFVAIILTLLTSADMYFSIFIDKIMNNFNNMFNFTTIKNNILTLVIYFIIFFSVFINIIKNKDTKDSLTKKKKIESSIANTLLIMINFVFVLFIISEISKITVNFLQLPSEYTYAMYAREGFFQLLLVTVINFSIILFFLYKTDAIKENKLLRNLILLLIMFTITLIFNSYYRMFLYMHEFGFTILRTQVILFLTMELILSLIIIKKIMANLKHRDGNIFTSVIITTYVINIFLCNSNFINYINRLIGK